MRISATDILCGNRSSHGKGVYHANLEEVRDCHAGRYDDDGFP
jgi:hypothetical protein